MNEQQINELCETEKTGKPNCETDTDKWGYAVCFGTVITFIAGIGHVNSFGLIYNDFMKNTNSSAKSLTTAHGVFSMMLAIGGIILNVVSKKYSLRTGGLIGSIVFVMGSFATIFITNTNQLSFTFGLLQGVGFGIMVPVCYGTINYYFVKKRTTIMSLCKAVQGIMQMIYPQLLKLFMTVYGFRGTLLIISGISMHTIAGMMVMKIINICETLKNRIAKYAEKGIANHENVELMIAQDREKDSKSEINGTINDVSKSSLRIKVVEILKIRVLKDIKYCNIVIGQSFVNFSDLTFFILQPMLLFQYGYDETKVAMCISIVAGADLSGRFILAIVSCFVTVNTRLLFFIATVLTFTFRIALLQVRQYIFIAIVTALLGVLRAWLHVTSPLIIASHVTHDDFPGAYALFMLTTGLVNVMFGPIIGLLKDVYEDYIPAFYALTLCCLPCLLLWPLEYMYYKK